jgi:hypothetical protein
MPTRAELARQRAEEEKQRINAITRRQADEAADVVVVSGGTAPNGIVSVTEPGQGSAGAPASTGIAEPTIPANGPSADRPIATPAPKPKVDRQGIDLRPEDRERVIRFEMFCLQNRLKTGRKRGLTLYARAGFRLLEELIATDKAKAEALLRSVAEVASGGQ